MPPIAVRWETGKASHFELKMQAKQTVTLQISVSISAKSASLQVFPIIVYGIIIYSFDWVKIIGVPCNHQAHYYLWALHLMVPLLRMFLPSPDPHIVLPFYLNPSLPSLPIFSPLFPLFFLFPQLYLLLSSLLLLPLPLSIPPFPLPYPFIPSPNFPHRPALYPTVFLF